MQEESGLTRSIDTGLMTQLDRRPRAGCSDVRMEGVEVNGRMVSSSAGSGFKQPRAFLQMARSEG